MVKIRRKTAQCPASTKPSTHKMSRNISSKLQYLVSNPDPKEPNAQFYWRYTDFNNTAVQFGLINRRSANTGNFLRQAQQNYKRTKKNELNSFLE